MRHTAEKLVDALLEGRVTSWLSDLIQGAKNLTGIGHDSLGMGKNTEKGWKPKYGPVGSAYAPKKKPARPAGDGNKTWNLN
jgi:hypothetical protein